MKRQVERYPVAHHGFQQPDLFPHELERNLGNTLSYNGVWELWRSLLSFFLWISVSGCRKDLVEVGLWVDLDMFLNGLHHFLFSSVLRESKIVTEDV